MMAHALDLVDWSSGLVDLLVQHKFDNGVSLTAFAPN